MKENARRNLFELNFSQQYHLYAAWKNLLNLAMPISHGKFKLERLELQPPVAPGPQDIPHGRVARPELAGALFGYINFLENLQSYLNSTY